jgi:uncharacterized membrane protein (UPF0127 family)
MPARRFRGLPTARILGVQLPQATTRRARLLGLAHLHREAAGPGLLLARCRSIHTFGMRFPIDVLFLDADGRVLERREAVGPRRFLGCRSAVAVAELPAPGGEGDLPRA